MATDEQAKLDRLKMPDIGDKLDGRYLIQSVLATGGMGVVLRAEQLPMKRPVAIKLLHPHIAAGNDKLVGRFEQEVRLAKLLNHPNTIRLYDFGESREGLVFVAMEYLDGVDLKRLVAEEGCLPLGRAVDITRQMLDGLAEAHSHDFIHRDLKPSNVFISENRRGQDFVKLLDFGIAKSLDGSELDLTASGSICGTPGYVAPEYLRSEPLRKASDVYAVGLMLLEMILGQRVFKGDSPVQTMMMHLQIDPDIPPEIAKTPLAPIIRKATTKNPDERYQDADQMLQAIEAIADEIPEGLRLKNYETPKERRVSDQAVTPPPKVKDRLDAESSQASLEEDSSASIPQAEPTPISMGVQKSGPHSLSPPPLPGADAVPEVDSAEFALVDAEMSVPNPGKMWLVGGGLAAFIGSLLLAFVMVDPGQPDELDEAAAQESDMAESADEPENVVEPASSPALAAKESDAGPDAKQVKKLRFDLDTDPSGATVRVGEETIGTTPLVYRVLPEELPREVTFELEGYSQKVTELTRDGSPIVVEVLDKIRRGGQASARTRKRRGGSTSRAGRGERKKKKLSDDKVEKVLDELLIE